MRIKPENNVQSETKNKLPDGKVSGKFLTNNFSGLACHLASHSFAYTPISVVPEVIPPELGCVVHHPRTNDQEC